MMYPCKKCGICCRNIGRVFFARNMVDEDNVCKYLNLDTNLCTIYETRPIFCNVDKYYDLYLSEKMSRADFYKMNEETCLDLRKGILEDSKYNAK